MSEGRDNVARAFEVAGFVDWAQSLPKTQSIFAASGFAEWKSLLDAHPEECISGLDRDAGELFAEADAMRDQVRRRIAERTLR